MEAKKGGDNLEFTPWGKTEYEANCFIFNDDNVISESSTSKTESSRKRSRKTLSIRRTISATFAPQERKKGVKYWRAVCWVLGLTLKLHKQVRFRRALFGKSSSALSHVETNMLRKLHDSTTWEVCLQGLVIIPNSPARRVWNIFMVIFVYWVLIFVPLKAAFRFENPIIDVCHYLLFFIYAFFFNYFNLHMFIYVLMHSSIIDFPNTNTFATLSVRRFDSGIVFWGRNSAEFFPCFC